MECARICVLILSVYLIGEAHAAVSQEQMVKMADGFRRTCTSKTGADPALVSGVREGKFVEDPLVKCYTKCIMSAMKTITKQGTIDIDMLIKQINMMVSSDIAESMMKTARECYEETHADDPCELAWLFTKCGYVKNPELYFFP